MPDLLWEVAPIRVMLQAKNGKAPTLPMFAISLGVFAALCWSVHDLLAKIHATRTGPYRMAFWVMAVGIAAVAVPVLWRGQGIDFFEPALWTALVMGLFYAGAVAGLFKAFSLAPVSIVGPFTAGYPALVVFWHLFEGLVPSLLEWLALLLAACGAVVVARMGPKDGGLKTIAPGKLPVVIFASVAAAICFATTIVLGQSAAATLGQYETTLFSRFPAALALLPFALRDKGSLPAMTGGAWSGISAMAVLDVAAVSAVNAAGFFPGSEYSAMGISLYGGIAVVLATIFLKDKVSFGQWLGIAMIIAGVAILGWPK